jgi:hypothetical protein
MTKVCFYVATRFMGNDLFNPDSPNNRDNCLAPERGIKELLNAQNIHVGTQDIITPEKCDLLFCLDEIPHNINEYNVPKVLLVREIETVRKKNWKRKFHKHFDRVLIWRTDYPEEEKYEHYFPPYLFKNNISDFKNLRSGKVCMIAMNKASFDKRELYSERKKVIRWFETNAPEDFHLYGKGWNIRRSYPYPFSFLRRSRFISNFGFRPYYSYRGEINSKHEVLIDYHYSICFENAKEIPGNISEKIFDCFTAGCIPVYWGAPDIEKYIPDDCFIDYRLYRSFDEMLRDLKLRLTDGRAEQMRSAIYNYLHSDAKQIFSVNAYSSKVSGVILKLLKQ